MLITSGSSSGRALYKERRALQQQLDTNVQPALAKAQKESVKIVAKPLKPFVHQIKKSVSKEVVLQSKRTPESKLWDILDKMGFDRKKMDDYDMVQIFLGSKDKSQIASAKFFEYKTVGERALFTAYTSEHYKPINNALREGGSARGDFADYFEAMETFYANIDKKSVKEVSLYRGQNIVDYEGLPITDSLKLLQTMEGLFDSLIKGEVTNNKPKIVLKGFSSFTEDRGLVDKIFRKKKGVVFYVEN